MKNLKKVLLISISIFLTINTFAQSRENRLNLTFESKSEKLTSAIGWKINKETGKWFDNNNVIEDRACPKYWVSYVPQNFNWIQFSTIKQNGIELYVLLYERLGGEYKYPNIREDWEPNTQTHFMVIDSTEYKKLQNKEVGLLQLLQSNPSLSFRKIVLPNSTWKTNTTLCYSTPIITLIEVAAWPTLILRSSSPTTHSSTIIITTLGLIP